MASDEELDKMQVALTAEDDPRGPVPASSGGRDDSPARESAFSMPVKLSYSHSKPCTCCMCNARSIDAAPFDYPDPETGGCRPWTKYRKISLPDQEEVKVPEGRICLPCYNVFRSLGLPAVY